MWQRYRNILSLGLPILIGQLGMIVTGFADTFMVGRYSTEALAAASFVNGMFNVAILACVGFSYGMTPIVGALFTKGKELEIGGMVKAGVVVNLVFAVAVTAIMAAVYARVEHLGQPAELIPLIKPYFLTFLAGVVPIALFNVMAQWSYAINITKMPMWIILGANAVNIVLNRLLIYGDCGLPEMGLLGAGVGTLAARLLAMAGIFAVFVADRRFVSYRKGFATLRAGRSRLGEVARISWPVGLQMTLESGSFSAAAVMAGWLGALELASFQILLTIGTLGFCVYYSMAAAVSVLVANEKGRDSLGGMRRVALDGYVIALALATGASATFYFFGHGMIHFFTCDERVVAMTASLILPLIIYQFGDATQINFANALRGTKRVTVMSWIAFVSYVVVGLPATYVLGFPAGLGIYGIILSFSVSLFLAAALFFFYFMRYTRR